MASYRAILTTPIARPNNISVMVQWPLLSSRALIVSQRVEAFVLWGPAIFRLFQGIVFADSSIEPVSLLRRPRPAASSSL